MQPPHRHCHNTFPYIINTLPSITKMFQIFPSLSPQVHVLSDVVELTAVALLGEGHREPRAAQSAAVCLSPRDSESRTLAFH